MDDLISRQAAIDAADRADYTGLAVEDVKKVTDEVVKEIKKLPSAQQWIPVTERLPENDCQCIVTAKVKHVDNYPDYEVDTADYADGVFTTANSWWGIESIIAWMPLPKPFRKGEEDE